MFLKFKQDMFLGFTVVEKINIQYSHTSNLELTIKIKFKNFTDKRNNMLSFGSCLQQANRSPKQLAMILPHAIF